MSRKMLLFAALTTCLLVISTVANEAGETAQAQTSASGSPQASQPRTIPYSGHLTDTAGQAVPDGAYDFTFSLYDAAQDGSSLWTEKQTGVTVKAGVFTTSLGKITPLPESVFAMKQVWIEVSLQGPGESAFTALAPRQMIFPTGPAATSTLTCPHSHFGDYWTGATTQQYGLGVENDGTGDGIRAFSASTTASYAALWAQNMATTGNGLAVFAGSTTGTGLHAESDLSDGLEATTGAPLANNKSAVYAHSVNGNGVWGVSANRIGVRGASTSSYGVSGNSANSYGGYFESANSSGVYIKTDVPITTYAAVIDGGLNVINGHCIGCALAYVGRNSGAQPIQAGDFVAASGVEVEAATNQPMLLVSLATGAADPIIGVATGAAAAPSAANQKGPASPGAAGEGLVAQGEYVTVMISGLAQVKVSGPNLKIGDYLAPGANGAALAATATGSRARLMSAPDGNGIAWAMVISH